MSTTRIQDRPNDDFCDIYNAQYHDIVSSWSTAPFRTFKIGNKFAKFESDVWHRIGGELQKRNEEIVLEKLSRKYVQDEATNVHEKGAEVTTSSETKI